MFVFSCKNIAIKRQHNAQGTSWAEWWAMISLIGFLIANCAYERRLNRHGLCVAGQIVFLCGQDQRESTSLLPRHLCLLAALLPLNILCFILVFFFRHPDAAACKEEQDDPDINNRGPYLVWDSHSIWKLKFVTVYFVRWSMSMSRAMWCFWLFFWCGGGGVMITFHPLLEQKQEII